MYLLFITCQKQNNKRFACCIIRNYLSPREEAAAGVALGVVDEAGPGEPRGGAQQEVAGAGVAAEDPVVGGGVLCPGAAAGPARVEQRVGDELRGDPGRGARRPRVDGLVAGEDPGVLAAAAAAAGAAEPEPGAGSRASSLRLWLGSSLDKCVRRRDPGLGLGEDNNAQEEDGHLHLDIQLW